MTTDLDTRSSSTPPAGPAGAAPLGPSLTGGEAFDDTDPTELLGPLPEDLVDSPVLTRPPGDEPAGASRGGLWDRLGDRWATAATAAAAGCVLLGALLGVAKLTEGFPVMGEGTQQAGGAASSTAPPAEEPGQETPAAPASPPAAAAPSPPAEPTPSESQPEWGGALPEQSPAHPDDDPHDDDEEEEEDEDEDDRRDRDEREDDEH
ncbi:hypothetical protein HCJ93_00600 [Streptomyces sp. SBST2-5]|uniref:Uncharacterized protein n=1 Tax=Streptomyces composti TaxID=2720025 RepID=A0ABX0ZXB1_9ACTN|nr:hypothetical protein [Streptomyces composti]NJP48610.1 hypothetical protein [Streptomyces composti]